MMRKALILAIAAWSGFLAGCTGLPTQSPLDTQGGSPAHLPDLGGKADGHYQGSYSVTLPAGAFAVFKDVAVDCQVASGRLVAVDLVQPETMKTAEFFRELPRRIVAAQSLDVDVVAGVTYTSVAFKKAVEHALR